MMKQRWFSVAVAAVFLFTLGACNSNKGSGTSQEVRYASAKLSVDFNGETAQAAKARVARAKARTARFATAIVGTVDDIASITVDVMNGSSAIETGVGLMNNGGLWTVSLNSLPLGAQLTFIGHAYNSTGGEIFTGMTCQMMLGENDEIVIVMAPVTNGQTLQFPLIAQVSQPASITVSQTVPVSISVQGTEGETLSYQVTPAADGGAFDPATGSITLVGTSAAIVVNYTAPAVAGAYTHSITVTNSLNNTVATTFTTNVTNQQADPTVIVQFNPVITGVSAGRNGTDVIFSAQVSDTSGTGLSYTWSFNNGLSFADPSANPATLQGYDEAVTGLLTLRVANAIGGHTTVSYQINAGQFPATLNSNTLTLPQGLLRIGGGCQMSGSNGSVISLMIDENMEQEDLNNDGDMSDQVLGYYDINTGQTVNLGIAISQDIAIAGDIMAYTLADSRRLGWYSFTEQAAHETDIVPDGFGRGSSYVSRLVSGSMIAYVAAGKLNIYDTATGGNTVTMESVPDAGSPSFSGDLVVFVGTTGTLRYYNVTTGATTDTGEYGSLPVIDNGTIVYETADWKVAYYVTSTGMNVVTPISGDGHPSISNGIIAAFQNEGGAYGDLNGDGIIDESSSFLVLYDIPTGRMISTGYKLCCGVDINGFVITVCMDMPCSQGFMIMSDVVKQYFGR